MKRGEITAFLSFVFILLVSFTGGMLEVTTIQLAKNMGRINMERAIECVFAEYQKELLEEYDVFALDVSYETGSYSEKMILDRLDYYSGVNTNNTIESIQFLSDDNGTPFYEAVNCYMKHKYGIDIVEDKFGMTEIWKKQASDMNEYEVDIMNNNKELEDIPIVSIAELKKSPLLALVMPENQTVSEKSIDIKTTVSNRERMEGYGNFPVEEKILGTSDKLLFGEYILEHFDTAIDQAGNVLDYEVEYILAGKGSDRENIKDVINRLMGLRFAANYTYLLSSPEKKAEVRTMALGICAALAIPAITEAAAQGILLAWAYGESVVDVKTLLKGNKVPLVKDSMSWQLSLAGLMKLAEEKNVNDGADCERGMDYKEYLRILLYLESRKELTLRTLDLIELNLQKVYGQDFLKADQCVTKIEVKSKCNLRRRITYTFPLYFGYI